jgi:hypothetical protein
VGDLVNVRLTVDVQEDLWYVLVEDMLPAGLEALNESLATERSRTPKDQPEMPWRWWGYERKEVHDEKVTFFATYLPAGEHVFEYAARAVTPGTFSARPGEAYAMYRPEVWGRTDSARVVISPSAVKSRPPLAADFDRDCRVTEFDKALAADAWGALGARRDANRDGRQDVADIAATSGAEGGACGAAIPPAGENAGGLDMTLRTRPGEAGGTVIEVWGSPRGSVTDLAAFEVLFDLGMPAGDTSLEPGDVIGEPWLLGPSVAGTTLRLALAGDGSAVTGELLVASVVVDASVDAGSLQVRGAVAADSRGGRYRVSFDGADVTPRAAGLVFLPYAAQH